MKAMCYLLLFNFIDFLYKFLLLVLHFTFFVFFFFIIICFPFMMRAVWWNLFPILLLFIITFHNGIISSKSSQYLSFISWISSLSRFSSSCAFLVLHKNSSSSSSFFVWKFSYSPFYQFYATSYSVSSFYSRYFGSGCGNLGKNVSWKFFEGLNFKFIKKYF